MPENEVMKPRCVPALRESAESVWGYVLKEPQDGRRL